MNEERVVRSINYPRPLYLELRRQAEVEELTNREQVRAAVDGELKRLENALINSGFAAPEGERHLVRASIDKDVDTRIEQVANRLGLDYAAVLIACLRRHNQLRINDPAGDKLRAANADKKQKKERE